MTSIDLGRVGIWQGVLDQQPSARVRELVAEIEAMGWPSLWLPESTGRDAFVSSGVMLGATSTLKVATGIAQIHARDAVTMANAYRTIHEAYDGRFVLGIGVSHAPMIEGVRNQPYVKPFTLMKDYVAAMKAAPFTAVGADELPPFVLAALGPKMLRLAAGETAGAHPYFVPPEHTALARDTMGPDAYLAPEQMVILDPDASSARSLARKEMARYLALPNYANNLRRLGWSEDDLAGPSDRLVDAIIAWGGEDEVRARVQAHLDAGADHVCVQHLVEDRRNPPVAEWRRLADSLLSL
ncbi:MAG: LLM class F420-dependent oxidoreductase [Acidimicrobiia bacterium]|nr:LLM class F420-dependent oxidoreductase [Acidimicrobiia bacterium]